MSQNKIGALIFLALSIFYGYLASQIPVATGLEGPVKPATLPLFLSASGIVVSILLLLLPSEKVRADLVLDRNNLFRAVGLLVSMVIYGLTISSLGFLGATILFLITGFWVMGIRQQKVLFLLPVIVATFFWFVLTKILGIYLDTGWVSWLLSKFID